MTRLLGAVVPLLLGGSALLYAISLGVGTPQDPGPGMWPAVCSGLILVPAMVLLARWRQIDGTETFGRTSLDIAFGGLSLGVIIVLFAGVGAWPGVGMEVAFLALFAFWLKVLGREAWLTTVVVSLAGTAILHVIFIELLRAPIPHVIAFW